MANLTPAQKNVFQEAVNRLKDKKWFDGVCMDNFPEDDDCKSDFEDSVNSVMFETAMYDDPDFYKGDPSLAWDDENPAD